MKTLINSILVAPVRALVLMTARVIMAAAFLLATASVAHGDTLHWDGSVSGYWNNPLNWSENAIPADGDSLVFPESAMHVHNTNNIVGLNLDSIEIEAAGYSLNGNTVGLSGTLWISVNALIVTDVNLDISLDGSASIYTYSFLNTFQIDGDIALGGHDLDVGGYGGVLLYGVVGGTGSVTKYGNGTVTMLGSSANTYSGSTTVEEGTLVLNKSVQNAVPHALIIGGNDTGDPTATVRQDASFQIGSDVTINKMGTYDMNGSSETINDLIINGGADFDSGTSTLTIGGDVIVAGGGSAISGKLALYSGSHDFNINSEGMIIWPGAHCHLNADVSGAGNLTKTGPGSLKMSGDNTYTGTTIVEDGYIMVESDTALGSTAAGTTVNAGARMYIALFSLFGSRHIGAEALTLGGYVNSAGNSNSWAGDIVLNGDATVVVDGNYLNLAGAISGTGGLTKEGDGTLILSGSTGNTYSGNTVVETGTLELAKTAGTGVAIRYGSLTIGDGIGGAGADVVRFHANNQFWSTVPVTITGSGLLDFNGYADTVGALTFTGGRATSGSSGGLMYLAGTVTATNGSGTLQGHVYVSSTRTFNTAEASGANLYIHADVAGLGGINKTGSGQLWLYNSNSYEGATTISEGRVYALDDSALGVTSGGTTVNDGAALVLDNSAHVGGEALTLHGTGNGTLGALASIYGQNSWAGPITLASSTRFTTFQASDILEISGAIGGTGHVTMQGAGTIIYSGSSGNSYAGNTYVNSGTLELDKSVYNASIPGHLYIGDGGGGADADVVRLLTTSQIPSNSRVTVASSGLFDMNGLTEYCGSLAGSGHVKMGSGILGCGDDGTSTVFSGLVEGTGVFRKFGGGILTLTGNNTYTGDTEIQAGTLLVNGSQPGSDVIISSPGTLGGTGTVGDVNSQGAVAPGSSPGQLHAGDSGLSSGSTLAIELNGHLMGSGYDQLDVAGTADVTGATLAVSLGYLPAVGDSFVILNNDGVDAVSGTFAGLPEAASLTAGNATLVINYTGGTGNDVVLTVTNVTAAESLRFTSVEAAGSDIALTWEGGVPFYVVERTTALTNAVWAPVTPPMRETQTNLPMDAAAAFYRVRGD